MKMELRDAYRAVLGGSQMYLWLRRWESPARWCKRILSTRFEDGALQGTARSGQRSATWMYEQGMGCANRYTASAQSANSHKEISKTKHRHTLTTSFNLLSLFEHISFNFLEFLMLYQVVQQDEINRICFDSNNIVIKCIVHTPSLFIIVQFEWSSSALPIPKSIINLVMLNYDHILFHSLQDIIAPVNITSCMKK